MIQIAWLLPLPVISLAPFTVRAALVHIARMVSQDIILHIAGRACILGPGRPFCISGSVFRTIVEVVTGLRPVSPVTDIDAVIDVNVDIGFAIAAVHVRA